MNTRFVAGFGNLSFLGGWYHRESPGGCWLSKCPDLRGDAHCSFRSPLRFPLQGLCRGQCWRHGNQCMAESLSCSQSHRCGPWHNASGTWSIPVLVGQNCVFLVVDLFCWNDHDSSLTEEIALHCSLPHLITIMCFTATTPRLGPPRSVTGPVPLFLQGKRWKAQGM
jgi:hypothetical protein